MEKLYAERIEKMVVQHAATIEKIMEAQAAHVKAIEERHAATWTLTTTNARADLDRLATALERLAARVEDPGERSA